jgi:acetoin utilization deacetylase AcuC-like enzyme
VTTATSLVLSPGHVFEGHEEAPSRFQFLGNWETKPYPLTFIEPVPAPRQSVTAVHSERMLRQFEAACRQGPGITDYAPTYVTPSTYADAFLAVGAALGCTQAVLQGQARNAFAIVRPPGHHAGPESAGGFCLLNNLAIAARHALESGVERVMIVDFDAHHGNGTQAVFLDEPRATFFSTQQENIYPFTSGYMEDAPQARGRIVNLPLPARAGDHAFVMLTDQVLEPLVERSKPGMLFVSAGFDSHWDDPLAELGLSSAGYHAIARRLVELAEHACAGRIVFVLEGGYNPSHVATGVEAVLCALAGAPFSATDPSPYPEPQIADRIAAIRSLHGLK